MTDRFQYDALVDDALRSVVRRVLRQVADKGLPGSHHFYISFRSTDPGVRLPQYLRDKYPEEMTIVLQHQYWDLIITEEFFEVTVSFNKQQERIKVPFAALSAFVDPSVRFGLQFDRKDKAAGGERSDAMGAAPTPLPAPDKRTALGAPPATPGDAQPAATEGAAKSEAPAEAKPEDPASKIVKLDSFRKK
ncbi:MAG TPA: ClpXP protease specificity-enhancing factor SspB [Reyranella sp.]|nr:ClpXP protease specificity-enhancing factor SspB [Reyranella sp.]